MGAGGCIAQVSWCVLLALVTDSQQDHGHSGELLCLGALEDTRKLLLVSLGLIPPCVFFLHFLFSVLWL